MNTSHGRTRENKPHTKERLWTGPEEAAQTELEAEPETVGSPGGRVDPIIAVQKRAGGKAPAAGQGRGGVASPGAGRA